MLCFPIVADRLVFLVISRLALLQLGISVCAFWPYFLYDHTDWIVTLGIILFCWLSVLAIDFLVFLVSELIGTLISSALVGYGFIVFQYGAFLLLAVVAGNVVTILLFEPRILNLINTIFVPICWLLIAIAAFLLFAVMSLIGAKYWFIRGYINTQNFQHRRKSRAVRLTKIKNPYLLLEWKRVSRNKELIFFSNIKNILTVFILCGFLLRNFGKLGLPGTYSLELFLLVSCCAVNTISSTAYSSDPNRSYLAFLPISTHQLFLWKTIQGFIWGEITIFLFWFGTVFLHGLSVADACLLLIYGTMMNYACSWLGVFLDYKMPRSTNSTNELLHGNISRVIVLFVSVALTICEITFVAQGAIPMSALLFSTCISAAIVVAEFSYWLFCRRKEDFP